MTKQRNPYKDILINNPKNPLDYIIELEERLEFLEKRENKLQTIEQMFKNGSVDLEELRKIVMEVK